MSQPRVAVVGVCVCLSVCLFVSVDAYSGTTGYKASYARYEWLQNYTNLKYITVTFTVFERCAVKRSEKANMHNPAGLPPLVLCIYLGSTRNNEGRVSTSTCYLLAGVRLSVGY